MGCKSRRKRRKMETDDADRLVDSVGGESEVTSVSSQKLGQSDTSDSHSSSDEDILCSGKGYRIWNGTSCSLVLLHAMHVSCVVVNLC